MKGLHLLMFALLTACTTSPVEEALPAYVATSPTRTIAEINAAFRQQKDPLRKLFAGQQSEPGTLYVAFTVEPDGSVSNCRAVASDFSRAVTGTILEMVRGMQFGARNVPSYSMPDYPIKYEKP